MKSASLSGSLRESVGKQDAKTLRLASRVPGVLYGGKEQVHFSTDEIKLGKLVFTPDTYRVAFELGEKTVDCIIQEVQFHPVTDRITHLDLLEIVPGTPIRVQVPVRAMGTAAGVRDGGRLQTIYRRLPVVGLADKIPEAIEGDVSEMVLGDSLRVSDLKVDGCKITLNEEAVVLAVRRTRAAIAAAAGEGEEGEEGAEGGEGAEGAEGGDQK